MEILPTNKDGAAGPGQENEELEWGKQHIPYEPEIRLADRITALHDIPKVQGTGLPRQRTNRTAEALKHAEERDVAAYRALAQEIQERQEELADALLALINDLQYRVDRLENRRRIPVDYPPATRSEKKG
jgi:hypothetical protein